MPRAHWISYSVYSVRGRAGISVGREDGLSQEFLCLQNPLERRYLQFLLQVTTIPMERAKDRRQEGRNTEQFTPPWSSVPGRASSGNERIRVEERERRSLPKLLQDTVMMSRNVTSSSFRADLVPKVVGAKIDTATTRELKK
jgi:hypothetical protein